MTVGIIPLIVETLDAFQGSKFLFDPRRLGVDNSGKRTGAQPVPNEKYGGTSNEVVANPRKGKPRAATVLQAPFETVGRSGLMGLGAVLSRSHLSLHGRRDRQAQRS